ncbi:MAG TPA: TIGR03016 family PEP-CTERM system-associated outer membrane protein [Nitrosomonas nitrosa]|jgi:uncharacterized protein (PEP-CTERM system associated)|uniref:Uncharacterized protein, PEP-CTERM system associated n=1 Tax=Nitrosomonas nitrosa TaxID=52442 RepID=A0A1I4KXB3_9PROT|nr:TIGR03016 family PEP-CTERM system-associated outer membrane protein [Nitrosomonas nitrosa]PTQ88968.1 uncharacterized protein (PEP-CTERM system associated) [Nitrosomonas nitrosa]CAE6513035.1 conserved hypothetical protein [Nitrosomonas nitrosa]SFL83246.1 uncharacterized protein, PEP-CTERM system associated [Nitrosomonas nitrosa]HBZ30538.1 TIGR03016 family PEP-CTERM system-associated outer membrane protein [Nitrosomonas nitrosa]HNP50770.1 TIGR03016 family PEP-CTERM system-associated outer mem
MSSSNRNNYRCGFFFLVIFLITGNLLVFPVAAGDWRVEPRLNIIESYTDRLRLREGGSEFITQINPGVQVIGEGRRFNTNLNYMMNNLIYANNSEFSRIRHLLNANATAELIEDRFFVDGRALISQQNAFLFEPQAVDNVNPINRRSISRYSISPYFRHRFKDLASAELRYVYGEVHASGRGFFDNTSDSAIASVNSGSAFRTLGWGLNYSHTQIHRDQLRTIQLERSTGLLRYRLTPQFDLIATGGYERNSFISIRGKSSSPTWTAGFSWVPTERTEIDFAAGQRFFGDTYLASFNHRTRRTTWSLRYNEDITTFGQQALFGSSLATAASLSQLLSGMQNSDAILNQGIPFAFSDPNNFLTNRLFLQKRLEGILAINGRKNTVIFRGFNMSRRAYTGDEEDISLIGAANALLMRNTIQTGGNVSWNHRLTARTSANFNFSYMKIDFLTSDRLDDSLLFMFSLNKQITPNVNGMIGYFHNRRDSNQRGADFSSNTITASLNMNF